MFTGLSLERMASSSGCAVRDDKRRCEQSLMTLQPTLQLRRLFFGWLWRLPTPLGTGAVGPSTRVPDTWVRKQLLQV